MRADLAGVRVDFLPGHAELAEYAERHLAPLRVPSQGPAQITSTLRWWEGPPRRGRDPELEAWERLDRDLYRNNASLAWHRIEDFRALTLRARLREDGLDLAGEYHFSLGATPLRDRIRRMLYPRRTADLRRRRFTTLLYYLVYYPAFWWHERYGGYHPIHAAGVELDGRVILLAGPSGVGKSTLAVALAAEEGGRLLGDTFVLHDGLHVLPVREPLLIDEAARQWLGRRSAILERIEFRYSLGREGFSWVPERRSEGGRAALILFPSRAPEAFLRRLEPERAAARLTASNLIVNDLRRYWAFAGVLEMIDPARLVAAREAGISRLCEGAPAYALGVRRDRPADGVVAELRDLLETAPLEGPSS